jgi:hypothetical protein
MAPVIAQTQMTRTEWLQQLARCCRFDPRKMFDAHGKPKPITELEENEAAAIEQYEFHAEIPTADYSRKAFRVKIKFLDRLSALALWERLATGMRIVEKRQEDSMGDLFRRKSS